MMIFKYSYLLVIWGLALLVLQANCVPAIGQYYSSGETKRQLVVDKKLRSPNQDRFYDNLDSSAFIFKNNDFIDFQVTVANSGSETINGIKVTDYLPSNLVLVFGPTSWTIDSLTPGQNESRLIRARIVDVVGLSSCLSKFTNKVEARNGDLADSDSASYFVSCSIIPATGDNSLVIKTVFILTLVGVVLLIRRGIRGYWG